MIISFIGIHCYYTNVFSTIFFSNCQQYDLFSVIAGGF